MTRILTGLLLVAALSACATDAARQNVLLPATRLAWDGISPDIDRGLTAAVAGGTLTQAQADSFLAQKSTFIDALHSEEPPALQILWLPLKPWAEAGIEARMEAGEIGPRVALSLQERVTNFDDALRRYDGGGEDR